MLNLHNHSDNPLHPIKGGNLYKASKITTQPVFVNSRTTDGGTLLP